MDLHEFLGLLKGVKGSGNEYTAKCPAHDDRQASLCIAMGSKGIVVEMPGGMQNGRRCARHGTENGGFVLSHGRVGRSSEANDETTASKGSGKERFGGFRFAGNVGGDLPISKR